MAEPIAIIDSAQYPFAVLMTKLKQIAIGSRLRSWLMDDFRPQFAQINGAQSDTTGTQLTVDTATYINVGDVWRVYDSGEHVYVSAVDTSGNTLTVVRNVSNASSGEPGFPTAIADNDWLELQGNSSFEGTTSPAAIHTKETQYDNYCEITRDALHLSEDDIAVLVYGEQDLPYQVKKRGNEHKRSLIRKLWFNGKPRAESTTTPAQSGGIWWFLRKYGDSNQVVSQSDVTMEEFLTWVRHCFRYGMDSKLLFAPPLLCEAIDRWAQTGLTMRPSDTKWPLTINNIITAQGKLGVIKDLSLEGPVVGGGTYNYAFILDPDDLAWCYVRGRNTALLTGRELPDEDARKQEYLTEGCIQIKDYTKHGLLYGFTSYTV